MTELAETLTEQENNLPTELADFWALMRLPEPELWEQHPWADEGCGFWVLGVASRLCIYYNDHTRGFSVCRFERWGVIPECDCQGQSLAGAVHTARTL